MRFDRASGILLHPTSLPGPLGSGDLGASSYHFVDWLTVAGQSVWQTLPLGPVGMGDSPYMCLSAFAGEPILIDLHELLERGWLSKEQLNDVPVGDPNRLDFTQVRSYRMARLRMAFECFQAHGAPADKDDLHSFCERQRSWLEDYALFMSLKQRYNGREWNKWDAPFARRENEALRTARKELTQEIGFWKFTQWCFFRQWFALKRYANGKGVKIVGDIPIFIAFQSADAWSHPNLFYLDEQLQPTVVAGVPPDYFSETGQRWGNPLYHWEEMEKTGYAWFIDRIKTTLELVDIVRIDHFRGFAGYWQIPAAEKTAINGQWVPGPGAKLFDAIQTTLGRLPIIAEDLGMLTQDVFDLRDRYRFPGMRILQFAFAGDPTNSFLPHNYDPNTVVYSGTHDNDTTIGWFATATEREREYVRRYVGTDGREIHWDFIRLASESVADIAVFPLQDVLGLGSEARMNMPGKATGNWGWRFTWEQVQPWHALKLYEIAALSRRTRPDRLTLPEYPSGKPRP